MRFFKQAPLPVDAYKTNTYQWQGLKKNAP